MWDKATSFWGSLTPRQRSMVIIMGFIIVLGLMASYILYGTDWTPLLRG